MSSGSTGLDRRRALGRFSAGGFSTGFGAPLPLPFIFPLANITAASANDFPVPFVPFAGLPWAHVRRVGINPFVEFESLQGIHLIFGSVLPHHSRNKNVFYILSSHDLCCVMATKLLFFFSGTSLRQIANLDLISQVLTGHIQIGGPGRTCAKMG